MIAHKTIHFGEQTLHYRITGKGNTVVLIHGFAEDGTVWDQQPDLLQQSFQVIIPDLPGSGRSLYDPSSKSPAWTMDYFASCIRAILDHEKIDAAILIGHSMGGYIALALAELYPERVKAVGLFHSTALADSEERITVRRRGIEFIREHGAAKFLEQSIPNLFSPGFKKQYPAKVQEFIDRYAGFTPGSLIGYYEAMIARPDRTSILQKATRPVLFVMGEHDNTIPVAQVLPQTHLPAEAWVEILPHSGHMGMVEEAERTNEILLRFCQVV